MLRTTIGFLAVCLIALADSGVAQDFRVYTQVRDLNASTQPASRSLTMWHAGKVYDVIYLAGEVTILEPAQRRCTILNSNKRLLTSVDFDELKHLLQVAEGRLSQRVQELDANSNASRDLVETLRFQVHPRFSAELTMLKSNQKRMLLQSKPLTYDVLGQSGLPPEAVAAYLNYADWACRLNFVLHPQPVFPTARLELNQQLRKSGLFPLQVTLRAKLDQPLNLQAVHSLTWNLDTRDRESIHRWESLLRDPKLQRVSLMEYQRVALGKTTAKPR
jgi:hypothetical protein